MLVTWSRWEWLTKMWSIFARLSSGQVAHAGAGVDEDVVVDQERGRPQASADAAAAPQNPDPHLS